MSSNTITVQQINSVERYLKGLQKTICECLCEIDGQDFIADNWQHKNGGGGITRVLEGGAVIEKGGVNFSNVTGDQLPSAATSKRPELAGMKFQALGVSLVIHPRNPFAPTTHMNVRFFVAGLDTDKPVWWFGGGFDLTPYYGFVEDAQYWHQIAHDACAPFGDELYKEYKEWCDDYFYLPHRDEQRGIGGLFFDDINQLGFTQSFAFLQSIGDSFLDAYVPILQRRKDLSFSEQQRHWQCLRRGRYVEFNLVHDRGTLFGLQSNGRTESILMSLPPQVKWGYRVTPEKNSPEESLLCDYLKPKDWLAEAKQT